MKGIEFCRKKQGITQTQLAEILNVSQANVAQWENGSAFPRADKLPLLAKTLNCSIEDLYGTDSGQAV